jgi:hypothetical protein
MAQALVDVVRAIDRQRGVHDEYERKNGTWRHAVRTSRGVRAPGILRPARSCGSVSK